MEEFKMSKKKVYIVSHSHWDREWYMGFEHHHMRLVQLMDDLFDLFKNDPDFHSFHLDGQTVILDDYLAVRPEKRAELEHWIKAGKLKIGPFYILQDDFLISSEANVRNTQYGIKESKKYGQPVPLGYFPDTFGNMGQTAQMMQLSGLDTVAFGRGVTPTGFNNQTGQGEYDSTYSEMWWDGPDGSRVLGILFANWYSNGNEIPVERQAAQKYWQQKLADAEKFAATDDLLMMNGVDHQPVQKDLSQAIKVANELFPDYEFIHSSFEEYIMALKKDLPKDLSTISGELTSQATSGWYTLANTSSARVYIKQKNTEVQRLLENITEPAILIADGNNESNQDRLDFAWKTLLQNHPHDSICGCSVDEVFPGVMHRFETASQVGQDLTQNALAKFAAQIDTSKFSAKAHPFVVINTSESPKQEEVVISVKVNQRLFKDSAPQAAYDEMLAYVNELKDLAIIDEDKQIQPAKILRRYARFNYDLPDDKFRVPYMAAYVDVAVAPKLAAFSWKTLALVSDCPQVVKENLCQDTQAILENARLKVSVTPNGKIDVLDKKTNKQYTDVLRFEDTGDIGNEYIYKRSSDNKRLFFKAPLKKMVKDSLLNGQVLRYSHEELLPQSADERLAYEQQAVIDITNRTAGRSQKLVPFKLDVELKLLDDENRLQINVSGDNNILDHRLRAVVTTDFGATEHFAESIYEVVKRPNKVAKTWENPENPQHQQSFVALKGTDASIVVGNFGLNEYEVDQNGNEIAVTLLRCVGEMGDWGYFPTPQAQCQGPFNAQLSLAFTDGSQVEELMAYKQARSAQVKLLSVQSQHHAATLAPSATYLSVDNPAFAITATQKLPSGEVLVRGYNMTAQAQDVVVKYQGQEADSVVDLNNAKMVVAPNTTLRPAEIRTYQF
jgi:alpha-mannosidase